MVDIPDFSRAIALGIHRHRTRLGWSLGKLSEESGISKTHLWGLEQGHKNSPTLRTAYALCDALGCSFFALTGWDTSRPLISEREMALIIQHRQIFGDSL